MGSRAMCLPEAITLKMDVDLLLNPSLKRHMECEVEVVLALVFDHP